MNQCPAHADALYHGTGRCSIDSDHPGHHQFYLGNALITWSNQCPARRGTQQCSLERNHPARHEWPA